MNKNIIKYTLIAVLAALSVGLYFLNIPLSQNVKITLYALPLLFAGCCFDFKSCLLVGLLTGFVSQLVAYGLSVTTPFWMLAPIGWVLVSYLFNRMLKIKQLNVKLMIIVLFSSITATALNTLAMLAECWLMDDSWYTYAKIATELPARVITMILMIIPYSLLLYPLVNRVGPLYKKHFEKESDSYIKSETPNEIDK